MQDFDASSLAHAYLRAISGKHDEDWWAFDQVDHLIKKSGDLARAWEVTFHLIMQSESNEMLSSVAAGPLEDLLDVHSHHALDLLEQGCRNNPQLQSALSRVHMSFWHELFERWYALKQQYGFADATNCEPEIVVVAIMHSMEDYLYGRIQQRTYSQAIFNLLKKPLFRLDESAKRVLRAADWDAEMADEPELKAKVSRSLAELVSVGTSKAN